MFIYVPHCLPQTYHSHGAIHSEHHIIHWVFTSNYIFYTHLRRISLALAIWNEYSSAALPFHFVIYGFFEMALDMKLKSFFGEHQIRTWYISAVMDVHQCPVANGRGDSSESIPRYEKSQHRRWIWISLSSISFIPTARNRRVAATFSTTPHHTPNHFIHVGCPRAEIHPAPRENFVYKYSRRYRHRV